uniref:Uncharacterized protein n=1 Tax=Rhizophora mucronata TaxID=61149 RepID=A0A2P2NSY5_RHIMU
MLLNNISKKKDQIGVANKDYHKKKKQTET